MPTCPTPPPVGGDDLQSRVLPVDTVDVPAVVPPRSGLPSAGTGQLGPCGPDSAGQRTGGVGGVGEGHSRGRVTSWRSVKGIGGGSAVLLCWSIQIDECGRSWRSGAVVEQRLLNQWFLRITHYAEGLLEGLSELEWPQGIKTMQEEWIGRSAGAYFDFSLEVSRQDVRGKPLICFMDHFSRIGEARQSACSQLDQRQCLAHPTSPWQPTTSWSHSCR